MNGFANASRLGFTHVVTIDADGQHFPLPIRRYLLRRWSLPLMQLSWVPEIPQADGMPGKNTFANKFSNFWFKSRDWYSFRGYAIGF